MIRIFFGTSCLTSLTRVSLRSHSDRRFPANIWKFGQHKFLAGLTRVSLESHSGFIFVPMIWNFFGTAGPTSLARISLRSRPERCLPANIWKFVQQKIWRVSLESQSGLTRVSPTQKTEGNVCLISCSPFHRKLSSRR